MRSWFKTQSLVTIKIKKEREKKREREKKGTIIDHMTERKRRQNLAKCCRVVAAFLCKAEWINEIAPKWTYENNFLKKSSNYRSKMWYKIDVSWKNCCIHPPKLYDFSIVAASLSWNEQKTKWRPRTECGLTTMNQTTGKAIIRLILDYVLFCLNIWSCLNTELHWLQVKRCYFV